MKKIAILALIPLAILMLVGIVSAGDSIAIDPVEWASGTQTFWATSSSDSHDDNDCSVINWTITDGIVVTWIQTNSSVTNESNVSVLLSMDNFSDDLGADAYTVTATCYNGSAGIELVSDTELLGVDTTVPTCSFGSGMVSRGTYNPDATWLIVGANASSATIQFGKGGKVKTMTEIVAGDEFTYKGVVAEKIYSIIRAFTNDGYNTSSCTNLLYVEIDDDSTVQQVAALIGQQEVQKQAIADRLGDNKMIIVLLLGLGAFLIFRKR